MQQYLSIKKYNVRKFDNTYVGGNFREALTAKWKNGYSVISTLQIFGTTAITLCQEYVEETPSDELIQSIEEELGYKLPPFYIELMKLYNGGILVFTISIVVAPIQF